MYTYKILKNDKRPPISTERAGPNNVIIGDIVKFKNKKREIKYAVVDKIGDTMLTIRDLFFIDNKYFNLDDNHSEKNSPHKGALNYNYLRPSSNARYIEIVDRNQFQDNLDNKKSINTDDNIIINLEGIEYILENNILYKIKKVKGEKYGSLVNNKIYL